MVVDGGGPEGGNGVYGGYGVGFPAFGGCRRWALLLCWVMLWLMKLVLTVMMRVLIVKKNKKVSAVLVDGFSINGDVSFSFLSDRERPPSHKTMTIVFPKIRLCLDISLEAKTVFFLPWIKTGHMAFFLWLRVLPLTCQKCIYIHV